MRTLLLALSRAALAVAILATVGGCGTKAVAPADPPAAPAAQPATGPGALAKGGAPMGVDTLGNPVPTLCGNGVCEAPGDCFFCPDECGDTICGPILAANAPGANLPK